MEIALIIVAGAFIALAALERKMRREMKNERNRNTIRNN